MESWPPVVRSWTHSLSAGGQVLESTMEDTPAYANWKHYCSFRVNGVPKAQPRARRSMHPGKVYTPEGVQGWKLQVYLAAKEYLPREPFAGPVYLSIVFLMPRPKALTKRHREHWPFCVARPDRDNLEKAVMDVLQHKTVKGHVLQPGFWRDDAQVVSGPIVKRYAGEDQQPGAFITIETYEPTEAS